MNFRVGQKVVCVDAEYADGLKEGAIYTVLWTGHVDREGYFKGSLLPLGTLLIEVAVFDTMSWQYAAQRFRPLIERKTDIGWAHRIDRKVFGGVDA